MQDRDHQPTTDRRAMIAGIGGLAAGALLAGKASAGPLAPPPGPISPTPGPEPRIAVNSTNTPGDADNMFVIPAPGSYYLPQTLIGQQGKNGIRIAASHVTLDLNGFSMIGIPSARSAIVVGSGPPEDITIRNGGVHSWPENGIDLRFNAGVKNLFIEALHIAAIGLAGLIAPGLSTIRNCIVETCGSDGIFAGSDSHISDCVLLSNQGRGIVAQDSTIVTRCTIRESAGIGISTASACIVEGCTVRACSDTAISVFSGCRVENNTLQDNQSGIVAIESNLIARNNITRFVASSGSFGMLVGSRNRVDSNNVDRHSPGIRISGTGNIAIHNSVRAPAPYEIAADNTIGPLVSSANINSSNNPHANYIY